MNSGSHRSWGTQHKELKEVCKLMMAEYRHGMQHHDGEPSFIASITPKMVDIHTQILCFSEWLIAVKALGGRTSR